jgi:hypothetical protein
MNCKNCSHWNDGTRLGKYGECEKAGQSSPESWRDMGLHDKADPDTFEVQAVASDDSGLNIAFITGPEFGCVHFSGK